MCRYHGRRRHCGAVFHTDGSLYCLSIPITLTFLFTSFPSGGSEVKRLPAMQETRVQSLGREDPLGEGNGNPFQYSCLQNPMDRGAWWASAAAKSPQSCPTLRDPMDCSLSGSSVHGIFQARVLEWIAISFSKGIFPTQESNLGLPHCRQTLYCLSHQGSPLASKGLLNTVSKSSGPGNC